MRVVIAEDSVLLREGIARLLTDAGFAVVDRVGDGESLVESVVRHRPDIAIVDVRMPPEFRDEGLRAAILARQRVPGTAVLVLSQYVEERYATELLAGGAGRVGYLLKDRVADVTEFVDAVKRVAAGETVLDSEVVAQLVVRRRSNDRTRALSPREREVLTLMAEGRTNAAIADRLFVNAGTIEKHVTSIFGKLGLAESETDHRRVLA
ncbi:MAG: response regulator transcription factor, partial [Chloroflexota bacterium]|nr:response regulator transcription factor [Chloroflexota bacterium]